MTSRRASRLLVALIAAVAACGLALAQATSPAPSRSDSPDKLAASRFTAVDIFVDPQGAPLAAYQLEFLSDANRVKLVGIEGGEPATFKQPPYYDPAALMHSRVILAGLNAGAAQDLPARRTRIARLHLQITGDDSAVKPEFRAKLILAASPDEKPIPAAAVSVAESQGVER